MHDVRRTANLLGATSLALTDLLLAGATGAVRTSASGASALVVLAAGPGLSVTELGRRIGLSQPAAARMVDTLQADGLVQRRSGPGRAVTLTLTPAGRKAARHVLTARGDPLVEAVTALDEGEQQQLSRLLAKLLERLYQDIGSAELICRLCDRDSCTAGTTCPVGAAERKQQR